MASEEITLRSLSGAARLAAHLLSVEAGYGQAAQSKARSHLHCTPPGAPPPQRGGQGVRCEQVQVSTLLRSAQNALRKIAE